MSKVNVLPPDVVSKIAAGEVIERPASVIKELVENALDAHATSIEVTLKDGGKTHLQVKDNGNGIEQDDLEKIFLRHATSKIQNAEDLFNIQSLGFRGEALYSVAAIADILLQSKTPEADSGWETHVRGNEQLDLKPCSMGDHGTNIEVKEIFFNTPARKKFLKSNTAEINQVLNVFLPYTLIHHNCRFLLKHQNKDLIDLAPTKKIKSRIAQTLNFEEKHLIESEQDFPEKKIKIQVILGDINITRSRRDMQYLFVNGRPVNNKNVSYHMNEIYRLLLPQGSFPAFVILIHIPEDDLDVNIHPTKREVKIKDEQSLVFLLRHLSEQVLMTSSKAKQVKQEETPLGKNDMIQHYSSHREPSDRTPLYESKPDVFGTPTFESMPQRPTEQYTMPQFNHYASGVEKVYESNKGSLHDQLENSHYVGTFRQKYLLFESGKSMMIMDQHAAAERVTFEMLIKQMKKGSIEVQQLLSPYTIVLSPQDMVNWEHLQPKLEKLGFSCTQFDETTIAIHSYPALIKDPEKSVREVLAGGDLAQCDHDTIARRACRSSIMTGERLPEEKINYIKKELLNCLDPFTCPHGRPTVIELQESFLDKQFLR